MKRVLIHETEITGHRLEYIHHLYNKAREYTKTEFIFAVPEEFNKVKNKLEWKESSNISFHIFDSLESKDNLIIDSFIKSKQLRSIIKQYKIDTVFLISLMQFLPILPFMLRKRIKVSGIIYFIYLYDWKESSWFRKTQDVIKYYLFARMNVFNNIFILNDATSARYLNLKFKTNKFLFLPDPYVPISKKELYNIRKELKISKAKKIFLHFGVLTRSKGTIDILDAIKLLEIEELKNSCFIFAGKVNDDIKEDFYKKLNTQNKRVQMLCFDYFCEYSFIGSLCFSCDYILIPYKRTSQSSGLIGFAAQFNKPVISPEDKLLGRIVRDYHLGITVKNLNPTTLASTIREVKGLEFSSISNKYIEINNVYNFNKCIFENL